MLRANWWMAFSITLREINMVASGVNLALHDAAMKMGA